MSRVFLSYSHDSESHALKVIEFCNRLRADGVDAYIDRYEPAPPQGWPRWTVEQVESADFVLLICTDVKGGVKIDHFRGSWGFVLRDLRGRLERKPATRFAGRA